MQLIVGLGNPGKEYENTRHNIGFMVVDNYLSVSNVNWQLKFNGLYTNIIINNEKVHFLKPSTYMNLSGRAIKECSNFFKIDVKDILIIHDDLDLPLGKYRLKTNSSAGGHNGIKSVIEELGTTSFARLKVGISHNKNFDTKDYVLGKLNSKELEIIKEIYPTLNSILNDFLVHNINELMNKYNGNSQ